MKILFAFPSRSRPPKFKVTLQKLVSSLLRPELCCINVVVDDNDPRKPEYMAIVEQFKGVEIRTPGGNSTCKIDAVNRACQCDYPWDIVCVMSDDMHVVMHGIDERIRKDMTKHYPNRDGLLHYNDGYANHKLITFAIMGRKLFELIGHLYHSAYQSLYCDNEQMEVCDMLGRRVYIPIQVVEHKHPTNGPKNYREMDAQYKHTESFYGIDRPTYQKRKAMNFDLPLLTICVPTVVGREEKFNRLMADLELQRSKLANPNWVQIIFDKDNKEKSIGQKRDDLLRRSLGLFVQMTDDDDMLHPQALYMWTWIINNDNEKHKAAKDPAKYNYVTNIGFIEHCTFDGGNHTPVDRSARYQDWGDDVNGFKHVRTPDNKNPIRTAICIAAGGYADLRYGEDHEFSKRVLPYLKNEAYLKQELYFYKYETENHNEKYGIRE